MLFAHAFFFKTVFWFWLFWSAKRRSDHGWSPGWSRGKRRPRMLGWHSRLRLVFAGRRVEDQIQQVCFNQFILSKTPNQRDRIVIRWISCENFTKLRHKGTLGRFIPILANWQRRRYVTKDWQKDLTDLRWRGNGCIIYRFSQGKNRSFRV